MITGRLRLTGYGGDTETVVEIVGQTPKRLRIKAITRTRLGGRLRWLEVGDTVLVPTRAVRDNCQQCDGARGGVPGNENVINGKRLCDGDWCVHKPIACEMWYNLLAHDCWTDVLGCRSKGDTSQGRLARRPSEYGLNSVDPLRHQRCD